MPGPFDSDTPFTDMMKALTDPQVQARAQLEHASEAYMARTLTILQIMHLSKELFGEEYMEKICRPYQAAIDLMGEHMQEEVNKYQKEHGEI